VTELVVAALDAHVDRRHDHATRVARLANRMGRELGLDETRLQNLHFASLLHDLGMLKIPRSHQRDPAHYQKHPAIGHRMLSRIRLWRQVAPIVLHHHERFDGGGYPEGLAAEAIPFESRIVTVVDAFDAMTRDDDDRPAKTFEEALADLRQNAGTQFDPQVVAAFEGLASRGEIEL
jgi:putative nucleotidyltransferase with HDIG domain